MKNIRKIKILLLAGNLLLVGNLLHATMADTIKAIDDATTSVQAALSSATGSEKRIGDAITHINGKTTAELEIIDPATKDLNPATGKKKVGRAATSRLDYILEPVFKAF